MSEYCEIGNVTDVVAAWAETAGKPAAATLPRATAALAAVTASVLLAYIGFLFV
jgi:hypothetical protein